MLKCAFCFILMFLIVSGNPYSHANSECYIFNSTAAFFFISHLPWLQWVTERPYVSFTTPSPRTCVRKGGDGCGNEAEKEVSGDSAWLLLSSGGCTLWWLVALLSTFPRYTVVHRGGDTVLVTASHGRKGRQVLEEDLKILTKNVHTARLAHYSTALSGSFQSAQTPDRTVCHSCRPPAPTSSDGLSPSPFILHLFLAISSVCLRGNLSNTSPHSSSSSKFCCTPWCNPADTVS